METITNVVSSVTSTASKLVYGDQSKAETDAARTATNETGGTEPVSGQQGSGTIAEPYDQGNAPTPLDTTANKSTFLDYRNNETGGQEPISGEQGKGTVTEPFDQGNTGKTASGTNDEFLKLNPTLDGPQADAKTESSGDPKIYTNRQDDSYTGMPIVPLNPDQATSGPGTSAAAAPANTGITDKAGVSEKVWKETPLDDISRAGAPGAGPTALDVTPAAPASSTTTGGDAAIKTSAPDAVTAASSTYGSGTSENTEHTHGVDAIADAAKNSIVAKTQDGVSAPPNRDTPDFAKPDLTTENPATTKPSTDSSGIAGEKAGRKSESGKSPALGATTSNEEKEKDGKMSHLKEKLKNKLHIGSKDK